MSERQDGFDAFVDALGDLAEQLLTGDHVPQTVEELVAVIEEGEDLRHHVEPADLAAAIDLSKLHETVDLDELPEAAAEGEARQAVHLRKLLDAIDLTTLADSVDMREVWREGREFDDTIDDMMDDDASAETDGDDDDLIEVKADEGRVPADDGQAEAEVDDEQSVPGGFDGVEGDDLEALRMGVQQGVMEAVDEFREGILAAHAELAELQEANRRASEERRQNQTSNRNPTAVSTRPGGSQPLGSGTIKGSTVPKETKYSNTPNRKRIYGPRFEEETDE